VQNLPGPRCVKQRGKMTRESGKTASKTVQPDICHDPVFCRRNLGMLFMDFIAEIRRRHFVSNEDISSIARSLNLSRTTVRKHLLTTEEPVYQRKNQTSPKLGDFQDRLKQWLEIESHLPKKQRRSAQRLFEGLQAEGYRGAYDSVQRYVKYWLFDRLEMFTDGGAGQIKGTRQRRDGLMVDMKTPSDFGNNVHC